MHPLEQVFPIENGDFPASYVRIPVFAFSLHHGIRCVVLCDTLYPWQVDGDGDSCQISRCTWVKLHNQMCLEICTFSTCTVDGSEISNNHPGMYNNGINYRSLNWWAGFLPLVQYHGNLRGRFSLNATVFPTKKIPSLVRGSIRGTMMCFCSMYMLFEVWYQRTVSLIATDLVEDSPVFHRRKRRKKRSVHGTLWNLWRR